jgi:hypothetical protein
MGFTIELFFFPSLQEKSIILAAPILLGAYALTVNRNTKIYFISLFPFILLIGASHLHLIKKFNFFHSDKKVWVRALFANAIFLGFYMLGRFLGILVIKSWTKSA